MKKLTSVQLDGFLYGCAAMCAAAQAAFGNDEAYKYVNPYLLFWLRTLFGVLASGALAIKMFRSGRTNGNLSGHESTNQPKEKVP